MPSSVPTMDLASRIWFSTRQAAEYAGKHQDTVRKALESGDLKGHQRGAGARWSIHRDDLDAWIRGES